MARARARAFPRIFMLLVLIVFLLVGAVLWFDLLGLVDARTTVRPILDAFGWGKTETALNGDDPLLLEKQRLQKELEDLNLQKQDVANFFSKLRVQASDLEVKVNALQEKEKAQEDREKSFNEIQSQYDNKNANQDQNARYLVGMRPENAKAILENMDEIEAVEVLRKVEEQAQAAGETSIVSYWLSLLKPEKAASLQRKMVRKPGS